jgi:hypothetical protein
MAWRRTDRAVISYAQVVQRATEHLNAGRTAAEGSEVEIKEYDVCYVAWRKRPPRRNRRRPSTIGGAVIVIDKDTGEVTTWSGRPSEAIAQDYRRWRTQPDDLAEGW